MTRWTALMGIVIAAALGAPETVLAGTYTLSASRPPPTVTLNPVRSPLATATPTLTGTASTSSADRAQVYLGLYAGASAPRKLVRLLAGPRAANGSFSIKVAPGLPDGIYTALAAQGGYGGNGFSAPVTFAIEARPPSVIGRVLSLNRNGYVGIRVTCPAEAGYCVGDVLVVTSKRLQPVRGGPTGRLRLLFAQVRIRAGRTSFVTGKVQRSVVTQLRENVPMDVRVGAVLTPTEGRVIRVFGFRVLSFA